jgi:hypothetical protein
MRLGVRFGVSSPHCVPDRPARCAPSVGARARVYVPCARPAAASVATCVRRRADGAVLVAHARPLGSGIPLHTGRSYQDRGYQGVPVL